MIPKHILFFIFCITLVACNVEPVDLPLDEPINVDTPDDDNNDEEEDTDDDDTDDDNDETVLIKRIVETYSEDEVYTTNYSYDGNKLLQVEYSGGTKNVFTYENELLVRNDQYLNGELEAIVILEYDADGKLTQFTETWLNDVWTEDLIYKYIITYNNDNTLTNVRYRSDFGSEFELDATELYSYIGEQISKIVNEGDKYEILCSYDDKNGIYKNVHATEILNLLSETEFGALIWGNTNNITSYTEIEDGEVYGEDLYEYTSYNEQGYPKTGSTECFINGELIEISIEYFYE